MIRSLERGVLYGYRELGGNTLQEFHFRRAGLIRRHRTETECAEPVMCKADS